MTHHEIHSSRATATTSRRRAIKHLPRVSSYSHASSIDPGFVAISLGCIHTCPHCCCRAACGIRFGALFSRQRSFCFLYCDMYLRFRGCPVVLDIELCVSAWYHKTRCALLRSRCLLLAAASCGSQQRAAVCGVRQNFQNYMQYGAETKEPFCANENTKTSRSIQSTPSTSRRIFSFVETPCMDLRAGPTRKVICLLYTSPSPRDGLLSRMPSSA